MRSWDVTSIGESLLRLSVPAGHRFEAADSLQVSLGGAESNVCAALATLGRTTEWHSRVPASALGRAAVRRARAHGVSVRVATAPADERMGLYFVEFADPPRPVLVQYDRRDSAASRLTCDLVDWDALLDTRLLHLTGITPALSPSCADVVREAIQRARAAGVPVSFDVNYRSRLWSRAAAARALSPLVRDVEVLFCPLRDASLVVPEADEPWSAVRALAEFSGARHVVVTNGTDGTYAVTDGRQVHQPALPTTIVDRLGAGDALAAGVIHGWLDGSVVDGLAIGAALAAATLSQHGDMLILTREELAELLAHRLEIRR